MRLAHKVRASINSQWLLQHEAYEGTCHSDERLVHLRATPSKLQQNVASTHVYKSQKKNEFRLYSKGTTL